MTPVEWLLRGLAPLVRRRRWGADCPVGAPVPVVDRCAAVDCDSVPLTALAEGEGARVTCLEEPGSQQARTLAALGILPGADLTLIQRAPVYVFRMAQTELALDAGLASRVRVRREVEVAIPVGHRV